MNKNRQREIASMGGRAAHAKGTAHQWTKEEAAAAGRKGGVNSHRNLRAKKLAQSQVTSNPATQTVAAS